MQLDRRMLERLQRLDDEQLGNVIRKIASEAGIDPNLLGIDVDNIRSIRQALGATDEADLERLGAIYEEYRHNRRSK